MISHGLCLYLAKNLAFDHRPGALVLEIHLSFCHLPQGLADPFLLPLFELRDKPWLLVPALLLGVASRLPFLPE